MKVLSAIFILVISTSLHAQDARDSVDNIALKEQKDKLQYEDGYIFDSDFERKTWHEKMQIRGSWRYDLEEWILMLHGVPALPEYYRDDELGSNGGFCIA